MELIYLWVKEEKNIIDQKINFSPRFNCKFEDGILTINENKEYINIFPKNINICGIVGENGSGKTSLIKNIIKGINPHTISYDNKRELACWLNYEQNCIYIHTNLSNFIKEKINCDFPFIIENTQKSFYSIDTGYEKEKFESFYYYYSNNLEIDYELNDGYELNDEYIIHTELNKRNNLIDLGLNDKKLSNNLLTYLLDKDKNISTTIQDFFIPEELFIKKIFTKFLDDEDNKLYKDFKLKHNKFDKTLTKIEILLYLKNGFKKQFVNTHTVINTYLGDLENYLEEQKLNIFDTDKVDNIFNQVKNQFYQKLDEAINEAREIILRDHNIGNDSSSLILNEVERTLKFINNFENLFLVSKKINQDSFDIDIEKINENNIKYLKNLPSFLQVDFYQQKGFYQVSLSELSSGEQNLLRLIYAIKNIVNIRKNTKTFNVFLDEIENTLHPNWQRKIIYWLIELLKDYDKHFNIYIASHSPFIISDLPKDNIVFLKQGKQDTPFKEEQTFGANIHTLLSHSFFMKEGLMGEYARKKIEEIFDYLKNDKSLRTMKKKEVEPFINMIGEDILKEKLLMLLKIQNPKSNKQKIKDLKNEIKRLEKEND